MKDDVVVVDCHLIRGILMTVVIVSILTFSGVCLWRLCDVLLLNTSHSVSSSDAQLTFRDAYDMLSSSQNAWMTIIGFFGAIFGLLLPGVGFIFQRQSLDSERQTYKERFAKLQENIRMLHDEIDRERKEIECERKSLRESVWFGIGRNTERTLFDDATSILKGGKGDWMCLANFILQLEHVLDAYVKADKRSDVIRVVCCGRQVAEYAESNCGEAWAMAIRRIHDDTSQLCGLIYNETVNEVLKDDISELAWIRKFFGQF